MFRINVNNNFHTDGPSSSAAQLLEEISSQISRELPSPVFKAAEAGPLSQQHGLVLQQLARQLGLISQTNAALDGKITTVLGIGGLVVALTAGSSLAGLLGRPTPLSAGGILLVFGAFFIIAILTGFPSLPHEPLGLRGQGGMGKQKIYDAYIRADFEDSYDRVLSDYLRTVENMADLTKRKNRVVRLAMLLFLLEVTGLFMAVLGA